jgi:hypothetical protein
MIASTVGYMSSPFGSGPLLAAPVWINRKTYIPPAPVNLRAIDGFMVSSTIGYLSSPFGSGPLLAAPALITSNLLKAVDDARRRFGHAHPITQTGIRNLAFLYEQAGNQKQAELLHRELAEVVKQQAGSESLDYAAELATLALNLLNQQRYSEAESLLRICLTIRQKKEPNAWTTFITQSRLGGSLLGQEKYVEAEQLLRAAYDGMKQRQAKIPANAKRYLTETLERLVQLYDAWGKPEQTKKWRDQLDQAQTAPKDSTK